MTPDPVGEEGSGICSKPADGVSRALREQMDREKQRLYAPLFVPEENGIGWKELNMAISKAMQNYCGGVKCDALLQEGLSLLNQFEREAIPKLSASNPHDLMRAHEVMDILQVAQIVLHACLARKAGSAPLCFVRTDYPEESVSGRRHIVIRQENGKVKTREVPLRFFGDLKEEYEKRNRDYMAEAPYHPPLRKKKSLPAHPDPVSVRVQAAQGASVPLSLIPGSCSTRPLQLDTDRCIGCGRCASVCPCDVLTWASASGTRRAPDVSYPGECYYCGACVMVCPAPGALKLTHPLMNQARFVPTRRTGTAHGAYL